MGGHVRPVPPTPTPFGGRLASPGKAVPHSAEEENGRTFEDEVLFEDARIQVFGACEPGGPKQDASGFWSVEAHVCICSREQLVRIEGIEASLIRKQQQHAVGVKFSPRNTLGLCDGNLHAATKRFHASLHDIFSERPSASVEARLVRQDGRIIEHWFEMQLPVDVSAWLKPLPIDKPDAVAKAWDNARRTQRAPLPPELRHALQKCSPSDRDRAASCGGVLQKVGVGGELVYGGQLVKPPIYVFVALSSSAGSLTDVVARSEDSRLADCMLEAVIRRLSVLADSNSMH